MKPYHYSKTLLLFVLPMVMIAIVTGVSNADDTSAVLILESANSNENSYTDGQFISVLRGNVVFVYDDITIRSAQATWWRNDGVIRFNDSILVTRDRQTLTCDQMHFDKASNTLKAEGEFAFFDTTEQTRLLGQKANYDVERKHFLLTGDPKLIRFDTTETETLVITGTKMSYDDSLKKAMVEENVTIDKGPLSSRCPKASYFTKVNNARLYGNPHVTYNVHRITGDSIDLYFTEERLQGASVMGHSHGVYVDTSDTIADSTLTQVWSDSLYMSVSDSGHMDSLWAYGHVKSTHYASDDTGSVNEARGKMMVISFTSTGKVNDINIHGNAQSIYYVQDEEGDGRNEASGDSISVVFSGGKAQRLRLSGSVRGIYYPDDGL